MEKFPFEQLIGFLVFLILALSQAWTNLRQQKKRKKQTAPPHVKPTSETPHPVFEKPLEDLLEALGLPKQVQPKPVINSPKPSLPKPKKVFNQPDPVLRKEIPTIRQEEESPLTLPLRNDAKLFSLTKSISHSKPNRWQTLLKDRNQLQQAILISEILGKPKALTYFGS